MKTVLADESPWFANLWAGPTSNPDRLHQYVEGGAVVDGIDVGAFELCGDPGDVVLMTRGAFVLSRATPTPRPA